MWEFRGKSVEMDKPGWIYGDLRHCEGWTYITPIGSDTSESDGTESVMVNPATVSIWTGEVDDKGTKIFQGDKTLYSVKVKNKETGKLSEYQEKGIIHWGTWTDGEYGYKIKCWMIDSISYLKPNQKYRNPYWECLEESFLVIGSIHDEVK